MTDYNLDYLKTSEARQEIREYNKSYYRTTPLKVLTIENGIILPQKPCNFSVNRWMGLGGILDSEGNFVEMSGIKHAYRDGLVFGGKYEFEDSELCTKEDTVLYMGPFGSQWGHFLLEFCTRLWYCIENKYDGKIAYCGLSSKEGEIGEPYIEFFSLLDIKRENLLDIRKPTRFKKIIIPEQSLLRYKYFTEEYRKMIDYVCQNIISDNLVPYEKVYFTREDFVKKNKPNCEHGEKEIQETFELNGFKVLAPEMLSVSEAIFYVRNCKVFAGSVGSNSINAVFAPKNTEFIYIRRSPLTLIENFQIDEVTNAKKVTYIDCYYRPFRFFPRSLSTGPHFLGATKELLNFIKNEDMKELSKRVYAAAILKTWFWLFKLLIRYKFKLIIHYNYNFTGFNEETYKKNISKKIRKIKGRKKKQFIIYPFGEIGKITKKVLNECFSIHEKYIISHSADFQKIDCINFLSTMDTHCYVLFACNNNFIYDEMLDLLKKHVPEKQIIELFPRKKSKHTDIVIE